MGQKSIDCMLKCLSNLHKKFQPYISIKIKKITFPLAVRIDGRTGEMIKVNHRVSPLLKWIHSGFGGREALHCSLF